VCVHAICPPVALDYVVPYRAGFASHSSGGVTVTLGLGRVKSAPEWHRQAGVPGSVSSYSDQSMVS
jgi:hypothetical protein